MLRSPHAIWRLLPDDSPMPSLWLGILITKLLFFPAPAEKSRKEVIATYVSFYAPLL